MSRYTYHHRAQVVTAPPVRVVQYATMPKGDLANLASARGLPTDGTKPEIVARIEAADRG